MKEISTQVREWGRSLGVVIPKDTAVLEHIKSGDTVSFLLIKKTNPVSRTFGTFKFKKGTQEMLEAADKESWDE